MTDLHILFAVLRELRHISGDFVLTGQLTTFDQHHDGGSRHRLGDRSDQEKGICGQGNGGLLGTLSPAVRAHVAAPLATAFGNTFWWAVGPSLLALIPVSVLVMTQRRERDAPGAAKLETAAT